MKKFLLGAAALLAILAPGAASAQSGFVGLSYSSNDDTDIDTTALTGSTLIGENFQVDAGYGSLEAGGSDADAWTIGGHLFTRSDTMLWGVYLGYNQIEDVASLDEWTVAGQMQYYMDRSTISADLSYTQSDFFVDVDQWAIDGEFRHFFTDNFSFQGNVGYFDAEAGGSSIDGTTYGIGAEWQFDGAPVSIYGGWQGVDFDGGDSSSLGIGVRWNWGGTLLDRNRSGAGLGNPNGFLERFLTGDYSPR